MITDELKQRIRQTLGMVPTQEQERAMEVFAAFMTDRHEHTVMVMRGVAGTGKTTLAAAMVRAMVGLQQKMVLMAPTGRAAKVFSLYAGHEAYTIHRRIYRQKSLEGGFELNFNGARDTLYIVDEASMVSDSPATDSSLFAFHTSLLDDLIRFVYNDRNCRLMLSGDRAGRRLSARRRVRHSCQTYCVVTDCMSTNVTLTRCCARVRSRASCGMPQG